MAYCCKEYLCKHKYLSALGLLLALLIIYIININISENVFEIPHNGRIFERNPLRMSGTILSTDYPHQIPVDVDGKILLPLYVSVN